MEIDESNASRRHDEDDSAPEVRWVYITTSLCRHTPKSLGDTEMSSSFRHGLTIG